MQPRRVASVAGRLSTNCFSESSLNRGILHIFGGVFFTACVQIICLRQRAALANGLAHDVQNLLWRATGLGEAFVRAGLPCLLDEVGQVSVGNNNDGQLGKIRISRTFL